MPPKVFRFALLAILLLAARGGTADSKDSPTPLHVCYFDALDRDNKLTYTDTFTLEILPTPTRTKAPTHTYTASQTTGDTATRTDSATQTHSISSSSSISATRTDTATHSESLSNTETVSETMSSSSSDSETLTKDTVNKLIKAGNTQQSVDQTLKVSTLAAHLAAALATPESKAWKQLRIALSSQDLNNSTRFCDTAESQRKDAFGISVTCKQEDLLTSQKKQDLLRVVAFATAMHMSRLSVVPLQDSLKVPEFDSPFCKLFTVPQDHKSTGVKDADMVLYVASFPSSKNDMFAAGAPCSLLESDKRPVVGAITYTTKHITPSVYSVRVAAHEIAHTLGFTYKLMKDRFKLPIKEKPNVRHKSTVTELQSTTVIAKVKEHYSCNTATGMELEDEAGVLDAVSRSHWERRNALEELMAGIVTAGLYTTLTLATFEDTKVYKADFSKAETMRWGKGAGCDFLIKKCVENNQTNFTRMFCTGKEKTNTLCAPGNRGIGMCSQLKSGGGNLPEAYKYFSSGEVAGAELLTDRCPVVEEYKTMGCTDAGSWCMQIAEDGKVKCPVCGQASVSGAEVRVKLPNSSTVLACDATGGLKETTDKKNKTTTTLQHGCPTKDEVENGKQLRALFSPDETRQPPPSPPPPSQPNRTQDPTNPQQPAQTGKDETHATKNAAQPARSGELLLAFCAAIAFALG